MRVSAISKFSNLSYTADNNNNGINSDKKENKKFEFANKQLVYCIGAVAAVALASYALIHGHGRAASKNTKSNQSTNQVNLNKPLIKYGVVVKDAAKRIEIETKPFKYHFKEKDNTSYEQLISVDNKDGTGKSYQKFYRNGKLYETSVFNEKLGDKPETIKVTRYNFAYDENGKLTGVAKQDIDKDGYHYGIYSNGRFNPFPIYIKKPGEKDFTELKDIFTLEPLYEYDKRFNPMNF